MYTAPPVARQPLLLFISFSTSASASALRDVLLGHHHRYNQSLSLAIPNLSNSSQQEYKVSPGLHLWVRLLLKNMVLAFFFFFFNKNGVMKDITVIYHVTIMKESRYNELQEKVQDVCTCRNRWGSCSLSSGRCEKTRAITPRENGKEENVGQKTGMRIWNQCLVSACPILSGL